MTPEKAKRIQRIYDGIRLSVLIVFLLLLAVRLLKSVPNVAVHDDCDSIYQKIIPLEDIIKD